MKMIVKRRQAQERHFGTGQVERLLSWLGGDDNSASNRTEKLVVQNLPDGKTIQQATAEELGQATKEAMRSSRQEAEAIMKWLFSSLKSHDGSKCEAVMRSVISVIPTESVPRFVLIAARARPSLALTVAKTAAMLVPEETERIASAVESVVIIA